MSDYTQLPFINKVSNPEEFGNKVILICDSDHLDIMPEGLMVVMNNESGESASIKNPNGSATGLIQFTEATAKGLGTSTAALAQMSNVDQLDYVYKYLKPYADDINTPADTYLAVFYPEALYKDDTWQFPDWVVQGNPIFDTNHDGILTKGEFIQYVNDKYGQYFPPQDVQDAFQAEVKKKGI
jgi:hypothetical protein